MIPKGNQRGGGLQLAAHLQNTFDNDRVEIAELRGAIAPDLAGAFSEWHALAKATKCQKYLYSLSLNPSQKQPALSRAQYMDFIQRTEARLKLHGQPRAIVFHVKHGREHCHVVWSRVDVAEMRAVPMAHDRQKLRAVAQEFAKAHGIELPEGMKKNKGRERFEAHKQVVDLHEKQQEEQSGFTKQERMQFLAAAWKTATTPAEFSDALKAQDFILARGDQRGFVVIDLAGEVHSLTRQLKGVKAAEIRHRLGALQTDRLPTVREAQAVAQQRREALKKEIPSQSQTVAEQRRADLQKRHSDQRAALVAKAEELKLRHAREAGQLVVNQASAKAGIQDKRQAREEKGRTIPLLKYLPLDHLFKPLYKLKDLAVDKRQAMETKVLEKRHGYERQDMDRQMSALLRTQQRETKSLDTSLAREEFQRIAHLDRSKGVGEQGKGGQARPALTPEEEQRIAALKEEFNRMAKKPSRKPLSQLVDKFNRVVNADGKEKPQPLSAADKAIMPSETKDPTLREIFKGAAQPRDAETVDPKEEQRLREIFEEAARAAQQSKKDIDRNRHYRSTPPDRSIRF